MDNGRVRTNNYRPYATNDDRDFDWGWLGLLGLLGLAGMRNRERDRDRT
ncbi:WGxxGxxG-CTERM domain-containing protein [Paenibacillus sp. N4]|nr:WGxxGxxG-CTERM domain-containing protein [Paenibacillus vietnamensis]